MTPHEEYRKLQEEYDKRTCFLSCGPVEDDVAYQAVISRKEFLPFVIDDLMTDRAGWVAFSWIDKLTGKQPFIPEEMCGRYDLIRNTYIGWINHGRHKEDQVNNS